MIEFKNVTFAYKERDAILKGLSFTLSDGDWLTILGSNGSGKSTLGLLTNGLLLPQEGEVLVDGISTKESENIGALRKKVSIVFQNPDDQIVGATVEEDVAFGPCNLGLPRQEIKERVAEALNATGMMPYRDHAPHMLSGGQKQKTALAGALAMRPKHLVLDEASSMLDPVAREDFWEVLEKTRQSYGVSVINISHFPHEVLLGNGILLLEQGKEGVALWASS